MDADARRAGDVSLTPGNHDAYVRDAMHGLAADLRAMDPRRRRVRGCRAVPVLARARRRCADRPQLGDADRAVDGDRPTGRAAGRRARRHPRRRPARRASPGSSSSIIRRCRAAAGRCAGLTDARAFEPSSRRFGAEAILHGHAHKRMIHHLASPASRVEGGRNSNPWRAVRFVRFDRSAPARRLPSRTARTGGRGLARRRGRAAWNSAAAPSAKARRWRSDADESV